MDSDQLIRLRELCRDDAAFEQLSQILASESASSAIALQQSLSQTQHQLKRQQALTSVVNRIRENLELDTLLRVSTQEICQILEADRVAVYRFHPDWSGDFIAEFVTPGWVPLVGPDIRKVWADTYLQETQGGRYQNHESWAIDDIYQAELRPCHIELLEQFQAKAFVIVPIFVRQALWGLLAAYQNTSARVWQPEDIDLLAELGEQFGVAIQQSELLVKFWETQKLAHIGSWEYNLTSQKVTWTQETFHIFGLDPSRPEPSYSEILQQIYPDDRELLDRAVSQAAQNGIAYELDIRVIRPDGTLRWVVAKGQPFFNLVGQITLLFGTVFDITGRKQAENTLRERNLQLQAALQAAQMGTWSWDIWTGEILLSEQTAQIFGADSHTSPVTFESAFNRFYPDDRNQVSQAIDHALSDESPYELEIRIIRIDQAVRWVTIRGDVIRTDDRKPLRMLGVITDITERKRTESAIQALNQELSKSVTELTAVNQELEAFSYSVSHDLRAPLRSINGYSQALIEDCADQIDEQGQAYLQRIQAATTRMGQLIDDVLTLSRITRSDMKFDAVDLSAIARDAAATLQSQEPDRLVEFVIQSGLVSNGDPILLRILLTNLLENAWKFTSKHPTARIEFSSVLQDDGNTLYFVKDDGAGFDMAYANKLFGSFQRLHLVQDFPGTGIGLATVQRIVHRHGGRVWGVGAVEAGATFYFTLNAQ